MLRALTVAERDSHLANRRDSHLANRLVSALVYGWNDVPITTQERIFRDATLMFDGNRRPELLRFIQTYRKSLGVPVNPL